MENKSKFQQMLETLKAKGWTDEQLEKLATEVAQAAYTKFYTDAVSALTTEDFDVIEKIPSDEEAQVKIKELYKLRTGSDPDEEGKQFYETFAEKFLQELEHPSSDKPQE